MINAELGAYMRTQQKAKQRVKEAREDAPISPNTQLFPAEKNQEDEGQD
jgi:hypothetical protein